MTETDVYMIVNLSITDPGNYRTYEKGFFPILKKHGGEFVTYDDGVVHLEGDAPNDGRVIIFKFPSEQAARDWYEDPEYRAIAENRRAGAKLRFLSIVHGRPPRQ